ncbi:hypothetical protein RHE_CH00183 [Rhizobium etli CFN 42]|uniref:Uncharacterized protein n=1 Tax=Rhizobium etli (strain ATCC 51251 / DSM 11541 / JCM 21823 / NBRC 15573 / CFN 42) TaxID=347834 RepID=Q2KDS8_RHIEC|nr:hypothetical protein RHE_CH00183 [Rhizobium etli CFN 42]
MFQSGCGKLGCGYSIGNAETRSGPLRLCQSGGEGRQQGFSLAPVIKAALPVDMAKRGRSPQARCPLIGSCINIVERAERIIGACDDQSGEAHPL